MEYIKELNKLGLKDKESAVYLACLELGSAPVQKISSRSKVVRATTYVVLTSLLEKGLVTKFYEGKKTLFSAEPPRQLMRLLEKEREELDDKQEELEDLLPELQMLVKASGGKPAARYFEGKEGLHVMRQEIMQYCRPGDTIYNFTPYDQLLAVFPDDESTFRRQRRAKGIKSRTLITTKSNTLKEDFFKDQEIIKSLRFIPPEMFPSTSGMTIYRDRVAIGTFSGHQMGVIIESESIADMMRRLFDIAWIGAGTLPDNKGQK